MTIHELSGRLTPEIKKTLLQLARDSILNHLNGEQPTGGADDPAVTSLLSERRGVFVTLNGGGSLRGCIGLIVSADPLSESLPKMAVASATEDPRFPKVTADELDLLDIELSLLTIPEPTTDFQRIEVGRHGLIVRNGARSGLLLPQVAVEQGWNPRQFLAYTCLKAGLQPTAFQEPETTVETFEACVFSESDFGA